MYPQFLAVRMIYSTLCDRRAGLYGKEFQKAQIKTAEPKAAEFFHREQATDANTFLRAANRRGLLAVALASSPARRNEGDREVNPSLPWII